MADLQPTIPAIYFDFDGVLVDSEPLHFDCWNWALAELECRLEWGDFQRHCIGLSDDDMPTWLAAHFDQPFAAQDFAALVPRKRERFAQRIVADPPMCPGLPDLIWRVARGWPVALVTSSARSEVEPVLVQTGVRDAFRVCIFGEDVKRHKPHPDPYLRAQAELDVVGGVALEDSEAGRNSALRAGLTVLTVSSPRAVEQLLRAHLAI